MKSIKVITDEIGPDGKYKTKVLMNAEEKEAIKELIMDDVLTILENFNFPSRNKTQMQELVSNLKGISKAKMKLTDLLFSHGVMAIVGGILTYFAIKGH